MTDIRNKILLILIDFLLTGMKIYNIIFSKASLRKSERTKYEIQG